MAILFKSTKNLEGQVDEYLDTVSQGLLIFKEGVKDYLNKNEESFGERLTEIDKKESKADSLRRSIENDLYRHSLIPEHRGDVLGLLESIDDVIDTAKETLMQFSVENPSIPAELNESFQNLSEKGSLAAEAMVRASRAFFTDVNAVKDHLHKVYFYEKEADKISDHLKRAVFQNENLELAQKIHLRYFTLHIDNMADRAEDVADRLSIYTIKRSL